MSMNIYSRKNSSLRGPNEVPWKNRMRENKQISEVKAVLTNLYKHFGNGISWRLSLIVPNWLNKYTICSSFQSYFRSLSLDTFMRPCKGFKEAGRMGSKTTREPGAGCKNDQEAGSRRK